MTKSAQGWYWLAAGVLALGLNGVYHDGGVQWAERVTDRVLDRSQAWAELAPVRVQNMLERVRMAASRDDEKVACKWSTDMARIQTQLASQTGRIDAMAARRNVKWARLYANRERMQARLITTNFVSEASPACSRVRVNIPQIDIPQIEMPEIDIPRVDIPRIAIAVHNIPQINIPQITIPQITIPRIRVPPITVPRIRISAPVVASPVIHIDSGDQGPI